MPHALFKITPFDQCLLTSSLGPVRLTQNAVQWTPRQRLPKSPDEGRTDEGQGDREEESKEVIVFKQVRRKRVEQGISEAFGSA
jgi:hypothetical protein